MNAQIMSPAATMTYCEPSSSYVIGPLVTPAFKRACHRASPVVAFSATRSFELPPQNNRLPAVVSRPERVPLASHLWLHRTLPVW
jgi:hypothetical protein